MQKEELTNAPNREAVFVNLRAFIARSDVNLRLEVDERVIRLVHDYPLRSLRSSFAPQQTYEGVILPERVCEVA